MARTYSSGVNQQSGNPLSLPTEVVRVLEALPQAWMVTDISGIVKLSSDSIANYGIVVLDQVEEKQLLELIEQCRATGDSLATEILIAKTRTHPEQTLRVRLSPLNGDYCLVLIEDVTDERRLDAVRRDFVANISHELKTPVGALSLLAEAIETAADDPETVTHFAGRMRREASRLSTLVADLIDLSKLQDHQIDTASSEIDLDQMVTSALDDVQMLATAKEIEMVVGGTGNLKMRGNLDQLTSALRNLLTNAIHYSHPNTRVAIGTRLVDGIIEISVVDQGIGISLADQDRVFERFYRVDPARSRITGGTGLGLSIVKHVCAAHGGECTIWSQPGHGSTFTLHLPQHPDMRAIAATSEGEF
jgi:two-component system sensor histidine kinase SenX3